MDWFRHIIIVNVFDIQRAVHCDIRGRTKKFPELLKNVLKYLYKFETLVLFEVLPLWLDAAIPAPLPMLETLSKIFNGHLTACPLKI